MVLKFLFFGKEKNPDMSFPMIKLFLSGKFIYSKNGPKYLDGESS